MPQEAMLYAVNQDKSVGCYLCHHRCHIPLGGAGRCRIRENQGGKLVSRVYGQLIAGRPDPVEKKPLFHFLPGTRTFSIATGGCNFRCPFCQNHDISQVFYDQKGLPTQYVSPEEIIRQARESGCASVACTYTEPTIYFEYAYDVASLAREAVLANCWVTNGFMTPEAIDKIAPFLAAANVDLKCHDPKTYRDFLGGGLEGVLESLACLHEKGIWLEVTTLLVPGLNDSEAEIERMAEAIADISPDIPWHISRFFPQYRHQEAPPTPVETVLKALEMGRKASLRYLYCGNMRDGKWENTWCHHCGALLLRREGLGLIENHLNPSGTCPECGTPCAGFLE